MGDIQAIKPHRVETVPAGLSERLVWLCKFGKPRLSVPRDGWHANIEMNTNTTGSSFTVSTEFKLESPDAAVAQLIERMLETLATLHGATHD